MTAEEEDNENEDFAGIHSAVPEGRRESARARLNRPAETRAETSGEM